MFVSYVVCRLLSIVVVVVVKLLLIIFTDEMTMPKPEYKHYWVSSLNYSRVPSNQPAQKTQGLRWFQ